MVYDTSVSKQPLRAVFFNQNTMSLLTYIKDTRAEMKHTTWPTKSQAINYTILVIGISVVTALVLGVFDFLFSSGIQKIILK